MIRTKREMVVYSFYDWTGWQRHLEKMAAKGWMLDKIGNFGVRYHRSEPREVQYAVTYCADASEFNPRKPESQQTFEEFCAEAGWVRAASWHQMQVFRAPVEAPPMETDAGIQVKTVHASMKKNFIPSHVLLGVLALFQLLLRVASLCRDPLGELLTNTYLLQWVLWMLLLVFALGEIGTYAFWLRRARRMAWREGKFCPSRSWPGLQRVLVWGVAALTAAWILTLPGVELRVTALGGIGLMVVLLAIDAGIRALFRRLGLSAGVSRVLFWICSFVVAFALIFGFAVVMNRVDLSGWEDDAPVQAPLTAEELVPWITDAGEPEVYALQSVLMEGVFVRQEDGDGETVLYCEVYRAPFTWVLDVCENDLLHDYDGRNQYAYELEQWNYRGVDAAPWGAERAWLLYRGDECQQTWLVRWEDRVVLLYCYPFLIERQQTAAAELLQ